MRIVTGIPYEEIARMGKDLPTNDKSHQRGNLWA